LRPEQFYVYILASRRNGTLYVGVTNNIARRVWEHKQGLAGGFTKRYDVKTLVYYEATESLAAALEREKRIKWWKRKWKLELIESANPEWRDIYEQLL